MYSVIQPIEVLDDSDQMVSTWLVLNIDLATKQVGDIWIDNFVEADLVEHTWVVKTSDILRFAPEVLQHIVLGFETFDETEAEKDMDALLAAGDHFPAI